MSGRRIRSACWKLWQVMTLPHVVAIPGVSVTPYTVQDREFSILPVVLIGTVLLVLLVVLAIKHIYMKNRRIKTIHASPLAGQSFGVFQPSASLSPFRTGGTRVVKGRSPSAWKTLFTGCLGDPSWEAHIKSRVDEHIWMQQRLSLSRPVRKETEIRARQVNYDLQTDGSSSQVTGSLLPFGPTSSTGNPSPASSAQGSSRTEATHLGECARGLDHTSPRQCFSDQSTGRVESVSAGCSIRLVNNPYRTESYSFLPYRPSRNKTVSSPLMATRHSFLPSKLHVGYDRKPLPPLPPLPDDPFLPSVGLGLQHRADPVAALPDGKSSTCQLSSSIEESNGSRSLWFKPSEKRTTSEPPKVARFSSSIPKSNMAAPEVLVYATEQMNRRHQHRKVQFRPGRAGASPLRSPLIQNMEAIPPTSITTAKNKENIPSSLVSVTSDSTTELGDRMTPVMTDETVTALLYSLESAINDQTSTVTPDLLGIEAGTLGLDGPFDHSYPINDSALTLLVTGNDEWSFQEQSR